MNKYTRILKSFNISAFFICVFFVIFLVSTVEYSKYYWLFIAGALVFFVNMWFIQQQKFALAYLTFMFGACGLLFLFDSGVLDATRSYIFYIPLIMCNFIVADPQQRVLKYSTLVITLFCIISTSFFNFTPRLSQHLFKPEHQAIVSYFNVFCALSVTMIMLEIVVRSSNEAEDVIRLQEKSVRTKDQLLKSIAQNIDVGICRTDVGSNRLIYVNRAKVGMFGYDSEEELLKVAPAHLYANPDDRKKVVERIEADGAAINVETLFIRKDGSTFWGLMTSTRLIDDSGNVMYDGVLRDISEMKTIKQELIVAKDQAENASNAKSKFLSAMSHEIRTPMNAVIGITNLLLMKKREDKEEANNLKVLKSSAESLMSLLNNLLDFSRIEAGKIDLYPAYCNLNTMIRQVLDVYTFLAKEKGIELIDDIRLGEELYEADGARISQVVSNLLSNAIKFTTHGYVKFSVYATIGSENKGRLYFQVEDTGIGIEQGRQQSIFEVFTQETPEIARRFGGSGLGLSISNNILRKMNSVIAVKSQKNIGSVFTFELELPVRGATPAAKSSMPVSDKLALKGMRILLAEDNLVNIMVAKQLLAKWEVDLSIAKNGLEVLQILERETFDLILMDLHMPEMDGLEATHHIRKAGKTLPIIALTADALAETKDQATRAGMNGFVTKPFNPDDLYGKLCVFSPNKGHRAET